VLRGERGVHDRRRAQPLGAGLWQASVAHVPELDTIIVEAVSGGVRFDLRVSPRASRDAIGGVHDGALRVRITAPPVDGEANAAIIEALSKALKVPKRAVTIVAGATSKTKRVKVDGVTPEDVRALVRRLGR